MRHEIASPLLLEDDELELLWLDDDELLARDVLDAGVALCVVAAGVAGVMAGEACVVLAVAVGGVAGAPVDGGAASAAALSAMSAAPAATIKRTDMRTSLSQGAA